MGYTSIEARVSCDLHAHNDPRDDTDRALWNELMDQIARLLASPRYSSLRGLHERSSLPRERVSGYGWRGTSEE